MNTNNTSGAFLGAVAGLVGDTYAVKQVEYCGRTQEFLVRKLTALEAERIFGGFDAKNPKTAQGLRGKLIQAVVAVPNSDGGDPVHCTFDEAQQLPNDLANILQSLAFEVNGLGGGEKKDPEDASASGTSSL